ncbi:thiocillin family RiPP [Brevibacillus laterosporus]|uniref:Thiocillin family RiPP n=1 Tax=Brevibacillus halotolerans TaxID=1507437 RepID=A0ABT4HVG0_9BACL|nr:MULTISPECIES: thiocillin family RiPP [Brevibacillus]MCR8984840.1 thiocillin family RiPP [Brevibacillus laterosporus]MCZ0830568.1 thiocillin family RiPP [Brevibacillus halotolerans]
MDQKLGMVSQLELYAEELPAQLDMAIPASSAGSAGSAGTLSTPFSSAGTAGTASSAG